MNKRLFKLTIPTQQKLQEQQELVTVAV
jgi:hypothetical protein